MKRLLILPGGFEPSHLASVDSFSCKLPGCWFSPECFPADIPGHPFLSVFSRLPIQELLAALESDGKYDSSAGPSAAVTWLAGGGRGRRENLQDPHTMQHAPHVPTQTHFIDVAPKFQPAPGWLVVWNSTTMHEQSQPLLRELTSDSPWRTQMGVVAP